MKKIQATTITAAIAAFALYNVSAALAADGTTTPPPVADATPSAAPSASGSDNNQGGGRRQWNPEEMRKRMEDALKTELKATDEEWAVIQPLVEKVVELQRASFAGRGFGGMGRRGGGGPGGGGNAGGPGGGPTLMPEAEALRIALTTDSTTNDDLKTKLAALRDGRKKALADLEQARANLQKVLTLRQEAVLVSHGILE